MSNAKKPKKSESVKPTIEQTDEDQQKQIMVPMTPQMMEANCQLLDVAIKAQGASVAGPAMQLITHFQQAAKNGEHVLTD